LNPRTVVWFSCGAASAVAAKMTLKKSPDALLVYCDTGSEHPDNVRFRGDVEEWLGRKVLVLQSKKYRDIWEVFKKRRFLNSPAGALCTVEMKKVPRFDFQQPDDIQVFGYTAGEEPRAERFRAANFDVHMRTPLIEAGLGKADCHAVIREAGIKTPEMYRLGYVNNNCIGCVKGGAGYWNKIRRHFPEVFERMAKQEREIDASLLRDKNGKRLFLDELNPKVGRYSSEPPVFCGLLCEQVMEKP
jgi:3'-phosphoadenosine 5'-phosphosulfate sulfotransferase (PAPS reductase)/FAD synthetase